MNKLLEKEIWRDIEGYKGVYQISNYGRVRTFYSKGRGHAIIDRPRLMFPCINTSGYLALNLRKDGKNVYSSIHRLVALAFVEGDKKLTVNHKDENKLNNYYENLEWITHEDNSRYYMKRHINRYQGKNSWANKLNEVDVFNIRKEYSLGKCSSRSLGCKYGVSKTTILDIINNKIWKWIPKN